MKARGFVFYWLSILFVGLIALSGVSIYRLFQDSYVYGETIYLAPNNPYVFAVPMDYEVQFEGVEVLKSTDKKDPESLKIDLCVDDAAARYLYYVAPIPSGESSLTLTYVDQGPNGSIGAKVHRRHRIISTLRVQDFRDYEISYTQPSATPGECETSSMKGAFEQGKTEELLAFHRYRLRVDAINVFPKDGDPHEVSLYEGNKKAPYLSYLAEDGTFAVTKAGDYELRIHSPEDGAKSIPIHVNENTRLLDVVKANNPDLELSVEDSSMREVGSLDFLTLPEYEELATLPYAFPSLSLINVRGSGGSLYGRMDEPLLIPNHFPTLRIDDYYYAGITYPLCFVGEDREKTDLSIVYHGNPRFENALESSAISSFRNVDIRSENRNAFTLSYAPKTGYTSSFALIDRVQSLTIENVYSVTVDARNEANASKAKGVSCIHVDSFVLNDVAMATVYGGNGKNGVQTSVDTKAFEEQPNGMDGGYGLDCQALSWAMSPSFYDECVGHLIGLELYGGKGGEAGYLKPILGPMTVKGKDGNPDFAVKTKEITLPDKEGCNVLITDYRSDSTATRSSYPQNPAIDYRTL